MKHVFLPVRADIDQIMEAIPMAKGEREFVPLGAIQAEDFLVTAISYDEWLSNEPIDEEHDN